MERVCFRLRLRKELLDEYVKEHEHVWQDMQDALSETGWNNYSLFLDREDGTLIGYFETPSLENALARMNSKEVNERWQASMKKYFEELKGQRPDEGFTRLENIFYLK